MWSFVMRLTIFVMVLSLAPLLSGCGGAGDSQGAENVPMPEATFVPVPTFTPTPEAQAPATLAPDTPTPEAIETVAVAPTQGETVATPEPVEEESQPEAAPAATEPPLAESAPASNPRLVVSADAVNVRLGPGTGYEQIAVATRNSQFDVTGRNETGDWWQVCCFDGRPGWLFGTLVDLQNTASVAIAADIPSPPVATPTPEPVAVAPPPAQEPAPQPEVAPPPPAAEPPPAPPSTSHSGTAGNFDPNAQYQIVHYRVRGFGENNGGVFNQGGQHHIFITVLDQNGNGIDGVILKDAVGDKVNIVTGSKGPGKAEHAMYWDPYKLYVASDPSGPVTSQISNQMNTAHPHIPDIVGRIGSTDNEYAICPTPDDRCSPPFYHAHWSYEITFQKVR
jgi:uncharacterized protein YraI